MALLKYVLRDQSTAKTQLCDKRSLNKKYCRHTYPSIPPKIGIPSSKNKHQALKGVPRVGVEAQRLTLAIDKRALLRIVKVDTFMF